ncbi:MAG: ABC transporter substrate-binding protein [Trueperaceae bacterium]|nr:ABC transporter substrate-binding protein [Trueperaceae bacterium]
MKRGFATFAMLVLLATPMALAQDDQELVIVRPSDPVSLDAQQETTAPGAWVFGNVIEPLITLNADMEVEGRLATDWEFVSDRRLRFTLREGVTFHDGTPFNADAVKFTWDRALFADPPGRWASLAGPIEAVEVVDEYTVDIVAERAYGPLLLVSTMVYTGVVSPTAVEKHGDAYGRNPVGTGPFEFVEWQTNEQVVLEANDDYWRGRPELDRVVFRTVPENGARTLALRSGEADMLLKPSPSDLPSFEDDPDFDVLKATGLRVFYLGFNLEREPMDELLVRQAIAHAIDVPGIVDNLLEGAATVPTSVISPGVLGYTDMNLDERYPYDPERARELLQEAGFEMNADGVMERDGEELVLEMLPAAGRYLQDQEIAEVLQEFLRQVGIEVELDVFEWATTFTQLREGSLAYDMFTFGWLTTTADADYTMFSNFHSDEVPPESWNSWRYANERVDELLEEARAETDVETREELYAEVQEILAEDVPSVPIYNTIEVAVVGSDVNGFVPHPIEYNLDLYPVSIE